MAENKNIRELKKIVKYIEKTAESIRKKRCALKTGKIEEDIVQLVLVKRSSCRFFAIVLE